MLIFWAAAGVLAAAAAGLILFRAAGVARDGAVDPVPQLYRRQLSEIDDLAEAGLIGEAERKTAHAEAARRLLAATDAPAEAWSTGASGRGGVLAGVAGAAGLALILYLALGKPGAADQPYAARLKAWNAGDLRRLDAPEIAAVLRDKLKSRPTDAEGYRLLGVAEAASQNFPASVRALHKAAKLAPERTDIWRTLGEAQIFEAGGKVSADAAASFREVLKREPGDAAARFYLAEARSQAGQGAEAAGELRAILATLPAGDERRTMVEAAIQRAEGRPVVTADAGQQAMIRGMVDGLAARLAQSPEDPAGWVRLVRAYAVLGETAKRDAAYASARARYASQPKVLGELDAAARAEPMS